MALARAGAFLCPDATGSGPRPMGPIRLAPGPLDLQLTDASLR